MGGVGEKGRGDFGDERDEKPTGTTRLNPGWGHCWDVIRLVREERWVLKNNYHVYHKERISMKRMVIIKYGRIEVMERCMW